MTIQSTQYMGVNYRRFREPFSLDDLFSQNISDSHDAKHQRGMYMPMVEDFSMVDLRHIEIPEIRRYVMKIRNSNRLPRLVSNNFIACIAGTVGSQAVLRLYGIYAEINGVRDEKNFFVAEDMNSAVDWLIDKKGLEPNIKSRAADVFKETG